MGLHLSHFLVSLIPLMSKSPAPFRWLALLGAYVTDITVPFKLDSPSGRPRCDPSDSRRKEGLGGSSRRAFTWWSILDGGR